MCCNKIRAPLNQASHKDKSGGKQKAWPGGIVLRKADGWPDELIAKTAPELAKLRAASEHGASACSGFSLSNDLKAERGSYVLKTNLIFFHLICQECFVLYNLPPSRNCNLIHTKFWWWPAAGRQKKDTVEGGLQQLWQLWMMGLQSDSTSNCPPLLQ